MHLFTLNIFRPKLLFLVCARIHVVTVWSHLLCGRFELVEFVWLSLIKYLRHASRRRNRDRDRDEHSKGRNRDRDRARDRDVKPSGTPNNLALGIGGFLKQTSVQQQINPFTNLPHTPRYYEILKKRLQLPVWEYRERFTEILMKNQSFVLVGETGSGKTTQVERDII